MLKKIKNFVAVIAAFSMIAAPAAVPVAVHAANTDINGSLCSGSNIDVTGGSNTGCDASVTGTGGKVNTLLTNIINIFSAVVGAVAVIMLIVGGFRYITSGGASDKVGSAKNTLVYAIVGLIIVALAQLVVHFVLGQASNVAGS